MTTQINDKQTLWSNHISAWQASEHSQVAYCEQNNLSYSAFGYWRTRLKKEDKAQKDPAKAIRFASIKVKSDRQSHFTLKINDRHSIEIKNGFDKTLLSELIQTIEGSL